MRFKYITICFFAFLLWMMRKISHVKSRAGFWGGAAAGIYFCFKYCAGFQRRRIRLEGGEGCNHPPPMRCLMIKTAGVYFLCTCSR